MKRRAIGQSIVVLLTSGILLYPVHAQTITTFTSLQAWQAAVSGSPQFSANFQNFTKDIYFQTAAVNLGVFSVQQVGQDPVFGLFQNFIDVPPLQFTDNDGGANAAMYTKFGITTVNMTFGAPVFAWGANFFGARSGELLNLVLAGSAGGVIATVPVTMDTGFFGFVTSPMAAISQITFQSQLNNPVQSFGQGFGLENVIGAFASLPTLTAGHGCNGIFQGTFNGDVTVSTGQNCIFVNGDITGNVLVNGGNLTLMQTQVGHNVRIGKDDASEGDNERVSATDDAREGDDERVSATFTIGAGSTINGNLQIQNLSRGPSRGQVCGATVGRNLRFQGNQTAVLIGSTVPTSCAGNKIGDNLLINSNAGGTIADANVIGGNLLDDNNTGPAQVFNNTISRKLKCLNNSSITGGGNTAGEKQGQCASF
jgi:hypothetical protein